MVVALIAMPPPFLTQVIWPIAFLSILVIAGLFVTVTRKRLGQDERHRRAGLALMAMICGPLMGVSLAWLVNNTQGRMHPDDVREHYVAFTVIGCFAGVLSGIVFMLTRLIGSRANAKNGLKIKSLVDSDEL